MATPKEELTRLIERQPDDSSREEIVRELAFHVMVERGLAEGSVVTVVAPEENEPFDVSPEEEEMLLAALVEADRGEVISWDELREQLRRYG
jgi:hypothetical protein